MQWKDNQVTGSFNDSAWQLIVLLPALLAGLSLNAFPYPAGNLSFSDLAVSHAPNAVYLRQALVEFGTVPLWSPAILSGYPFAANPLAGLWYPPGWLALVLPLPLAFNLAVALHLAWAGLGMYCLLCQEKLAPPAAALGGLAFAAMPKLFAHYGAGHLTLLYAVPWTPWLLLAERQAESSRRWGGFILPGIVLAVIFMADVRWAAYAGLAWLGYALVRSPLWAARSSASAAWLFRLALAVLLAGLLAAPLGLPVWEYSRLSTRAQLPATEALALSLPPGKLLGLVFPTVGSLHEWVLYPGALVLALGGIGLLWRPTWRRAGYWIALIALGLAFSLGPVFPVAGWLLRLPGLSLLRVPSRALFLVGMGLGALAAYALDQIISGLQLAQVRRANLLLAALAGFAALLAGGAWAVQKQLLFALAWGGAAAVGAAVWTGVGLKGSLPRRFWLMGALGLLVLDLAVVDRQSYALRPAADVLAEGEPVARYLAAQPGQFRVYSPSYSLPQQTAARYRLEIADGVDPLQLAAYVDFMEKAGGVPVSGYSVTIPPYATGNPAVDNSRYLPEPGLLGLLNVRFVAAEFDLPVQGLVLKARLGETRLYENADWRPRAWLEEQGAQLPTLSNGSPLGSPELVSWSPNRVEISLEDTAHARPALLVLSEINYPGWRASVDGIDTPILDYAGILRAVAVNGSTHQVVFNYQPVSLYAGLAMGVLGVLLAVILWRRPAAAPGPKSLTGGQDGP